MIKANDTDILVIAVAMLERLQEKGLQELWVAYGKGCNVKWIPVHELTASLSPERIGGLLFFMPSLDVTLYQHLEKKERKQPCRHGISSLMLQRFS